jgi:hypothetical protein
MDSQFDDHIFYIYSCSNVLYFLAFLSQLILLIQIRKYKLANELSVTLLINIACWVIILFLAIIYSKVFVNKTFKFRILATYMVIFLESPYKSGEF